MIFDDFFAEALAPLLHERRYRVFAEIERIAGRFPSGIWHRPREVVTGARTITWAWSRPRPELEQAPGGRAISAGRILS